MTARARVLSLLIAGVTGVAALAAQQTGRQQTPVFKAGIELVQVDVVVRDRDGLPIHGLVADDFMIFDRGTPQSIVTFKAMRRESAAAASFASRFPVTTRLDVSSNQTAQSGRLVIMVLDDLHAFRGRDETVKKIARGIIQELGQDSMMALLMTSGDYSVEVTEDRSRMMAAIDKFKGARLVRRPMPAVDNRRGGGDLQEFDANMRLYNTLQGAARLFSASDGRRKAFVLVSENLAKDLSGVLQVRDVPGDSILGGQEYASGDLEFKLAATPQTHAYEALKALELMRKSNVVTYAIDPRGEVPEGDIMKECQPSFGQERDPCLGGGFGGGGAPSSTGWVRVAQQGLQHISNASGGFAVVNSNDFTGGIDRIIDDLDNYYLLGFYTDDAKKKGYRKLEVLVKDRQDLQLRYRRGYEIGADAGAAPKNQDPLFALSAGALPKANVPLRITAAALPGSGKDARVPVALEVSVPRQSLEEADAKLRDQIRYAVVVVDMKGSKVKEANGYGAKLVLRPRATGGKAPDTLTYQIGLALELPPGRYHLRASASSEKLSDGGSVYLPIEVPDFAKDRIALSGLVLGYGSGARVPVVATAIAPARALGNRLGGIPPPARGRAGAPALGPGGLPFPPTLDRDFATSDDVILYFEIVRKDRAREVALDVMAVDAGDRVVRRFGQKVPPESAGKVSVRLPLKEIGAGAFRLRVHATDGVNEATNEIAIVIK